MGETEKKIVTNVMCGVSIIVGFFAAEKVYNAGMTGYMKLFHSDVWNEACKEIS